MDLAHVVANVVVKERETNVESSVSVEAFGGGVVVSTVGHSSIYHNYTSDRYR